MDSKRTTRQLQEAQDYAGKYRINCTWAASGTGHKTTNNICNQSFYRTFSVTPQETEGKPIYEIGNGQWNIPKLRELLEEILPKNTSFDNFEVDHEFHNLGRRIMLLNARLIHDGGSNIQKVLLAIEDITERKRVEHDMVFSELRYRRLLKQPRMAS